MSRTYPVKHETGWMGARRAANPTETVRDGGIRLWNTRIEREPLTGMPDVEVVPQHAGYVMRNSVYVWTGTGKMRGRK